MFLYRTGAAFVCMHAAGPVLRRKKKRTGYAAITAAFCRTDLLWFADSCRAGCWRSPAISGWTGCWPGCPSLSPRATKWPTLSMQLVTIGLALLPAPTRTNGFRPRTVGRTARVRAFCPDRAPVSLCWS